MGSSSTSARALHLLAELEQLDKGKDRQGMTVLERQRRSAICRELSRWAMAVTERDLPAGASARQHPRAQVRARVQLLGGPHVMELVSESLAVGGLSVRLTSFTPRVGDLWPLRLIVTDEAAPSPKLEIFELPDVAPIPELETGLELMAQVAWVDPGRSRAGARFVDVPEDARAVLERVVFREIVARTGVAR